MTKLRCPCGEMLNPSSIRNKDLSTYKKCVDLKRRRNKRSPCNDVCRRVVSYKKTQGPTKCCVTYRCNNDTCKCTYSILGKSKQAIFTRVKTLDITATVEDAKANR